MRTPLVCFLLATMLSGCSSFKRDWKTQGQISAPTATAIEGRWIGSWKSDQNHHTGRLRCLLSKQNDEIYLARFEAKFWKIFTGHYAVRLSVKPQEGAWQFFGTENLGWYAGGRYEYRGTINHTNFLSTYRCKVDHGTFRMGRP